MAKLTSTFNVLTILIFIYSVQGKLEISFSLPVVESNKTDQYLCFARKLDEFKSINVDGIELNVDNENAHHVSLSVCKAPSSDQQVWDCAAAQGKVCQGNAVNLGGWEARNKHSGKYILPKGLSVRVGKNTPMQYIVTQVHFKHAVKNATSAIANITVRLNTDGSTLNYQTYSFINEGYIPKLKNKGFFAESACQWTKPPVLLYTFSTHTHGHGVLVEGFLVRNGTWTVLGSQLKNGEEKHFQNVPGGPVSIHSGDILAARCLYINNEPRPIKFGMTWRPVFGLLVCICHLAESHGKDIQSKPCSHPMDIVFVLDGSESVTHNNFNKVKKFTTDIVDQFSIGSKDVRIGVIEFSTFIGTVIELGQVNNPSLLNFLISNISMSNVGTGTHKALKRMRDMFRERGRPEVPHIGVVITDGLSVSPYLTKEESRRVHQDGVVVFAVGIEGDKTFQTELEYISSSRDQALRVSDFDALPVNLSLSICSIAAPLSTPSTTVLTSSIIPDRIGESSGKNDGYVDESRYFQVHTTDCTKYIEVVPGVSGAAVTYVKSCSFGLFWDERSLSCINSTHAECNNDPCRKFSAGYVYQMDGLCSGFWTCLNKTSLPVCCTLGYRFKPAQGCVLDSTCGEPCPPKQNSLTNRDCRKWVDPNDAQSYLEEVHNRNISRPCAPGSFFDQSACACTRHNTQNPILATSVSPSVRTNHCRDELYLKFNKGQDGNIDGFKDFSGRNIHVAQRNVVISGRGDGMMKLDGISSCLNIWRFSNIEYRSLVIWIKFLALQSDNPQTQTKYQALLSNCYYKSCTASVAIVLDRIKHVIGVQTQTAGTGTYIWWHPTKYQDDAINEVRLSFDRKGTVINFSLNKENRKQYIQEMVLLRQTGLVIGAGGLFDNFKGFVDEIRVQHCDGDPTVDV